MIENSINLQVDSNPGSNIIPTVDRPDIAKTGQKKALTAKEIKDVFFKCLMLANIKFEENQKLHIFTTYTDKKTDRSHKVRTGFYTAACTLSQIKINNDPVHVILLRDEEDETEARQRNKILYLKNSYNLVVFDEEDWKAIGLEISDKEWLQALSKPIIKALFKKLFHKIAALNRGEVVSELNLNEIILNIDKNIAKNRVVVKNLLEENLNLKRKLKKLEFSKKLKIEDEHDDVLTCLISYDKSSTLFIEDVLTTITKFLFTTQFSQAKYNKFFRQKNGALNPINREKLSEYIIDSFRLAKPYITPISVCNGVILLQNKNTFQKVFVSISPTTTYIDTISLDKEGLQQVSEPIIFNITPLFVKEKTRIKQLSVEVFTKKDIKNFKILKANRMTVFKTNKQVPIKFN